jgi:hypothetical protein
MPGVRTEHQKTGMWESSLLQGQIEPLEELRGATNEPPMRTGMRTVMRHRVVRVVGRMSHEKIPPGSLKLILAELSLTFTSPVKVCRVYDGLWRSMTSTHMV